MVGRLLMAGVAAVILYSSTPAMAQYGGYRPPPPPAGAERGGREFEEMRQLRYSCDQGDRRACIRFGMMLGEHREYRREHPELYNWER